MINDKCQSYIKCLFPEVLNNPVDSIIASIDKLDLLELSPRTLIEQKYELYDNFVFDFPMYRNIVIKYAPAYIQIQYLLDYLIIVPKDICDLFNQADDELGWLDLSSLTDDINRDHEHRRLLNNLLEFENILSKNDLYNLQLKELINVTKLRLN